MTATFKSMPLGLKILTIISAFSFLSSLLSLSSVFGQKATSTATSPLLYVNGLILVAMFLYIVFSRSHKWWQIYIVWSIVSSIVGVLPLYTSLSTALSNAQQVMVITTGTLLVMMIAFQGLILFYIYKKKEYFNK